MRILVVEDDDRVAGALQSALLLRGYDVTRAQTAAAALAACAARRDIDLVLLDLGLPDRDGMVVAAALRAVAMPVIVVTARADVTSQVAALRGGADDFVVKPFSTDALMARIEAVLRRTQRMPTPPAAVIEIGDLRVDPAAPATAATTSTITTLRRRRRGTGGWGAARVVTGVSSARASWWCAFPIVADAQRGVCGVSFAAPPRQPATMNWRRARASAISRRAPSPSRVPRGNARANRQPVAQAPAFGCKRRVPRVVVEQCFKARAEVLREYGQRARHRSRSLATQHDRGRGGVAAVEAVGWLAA